MSTPNIAPSGNTHFLDAFYVARDELLTRLYEAWMPAESLAYPANSPTLRGLMEHRHQLAAHSPQLPNELLRSNTLFGIPLIEDPSLPTGHLRCVVRPDWQPEWLC